MQVVGRRRRSVRAPVLAVLVALAPAVAGCSGSDGDGAGSTVTTVATGSGTAENTEGSATTAPEQATTLADGTSTAPGSTATSAPVLEGASEGQRTAAAEGDGTALLAGVRVGVHEGYERIAFEFTGTARPGYRIQWVDGPITADGSGEPVEVAGDAYLEVIMQPASGFDMETGMPTYTAADRLPMARGSEVLVDLVRTFTAPTRLVIDLASPDAVAATGPSDG